MEITALHRPKKDNAEIIENELQDERNNLKLELNALKKNDYQLNLILIFRTYRKSAPGEGENEWHEIREKPEKLKKQLDDFGAINPLAVEAYNEMNERYAFIQAQKKDFQAMQKDRY